MQQKPTPRVKPITTKKLNSNLIPTIPEYVSEPTTVFVLFFTNLVFCLKIVRHRTGEWMDFLHSAHPAYISFEEMPNTIFKISYLTLEYFLER